ncbi:MAG: glutamyl-tRNA reductase [Chloroflexota bacterium]
MSVLLLGANHDTATVAVRECLTIPPERIAEALRFLSNHIGEIVLISTCNRTEFYAVNTRVAEPALRRFLYDHSGLAPGEIDHALYRMEGEDAVRHLLRVAAGLDSMILGEPQILGQVRDAWKLAHRAKSIGPVLDSLFRTALNTGKIARARTGISRGAVSVSHAAVEFARERFGNLSGKRILVVGAGETGALVARNLRSNGASKIIVANRTFDRAVDLASSLNAEASGFEELGESLRQVDIVISCTGASEPVITRDLVERACEETGRHILAIDIAVPRDIAPDVADVAGVSLYDLDDLQSRMAANVNERRTAAERVEETVDEQARQFLSWHAGHVAGPTIRALQERNDEIRQAQLERVLERLPGLDRDQRETLRIFSEQLVNALLHQPLTELRDPERGPANAEALRALFDIELPAEPPVDDAETSSDQSVA